MAAEPQEQATCGRGVRLVRAWGPEILVLLAVSVAVPMAVALHYRSLGAPSADDWAYDLSVWRLAFHGHLYLFHWSRITLIGQLVLAVPVAWLFGEHAWALNCLTSLEGMLGLLAICYLGRQMGLSRGLSLFAAAVLGLGPMWAAMSTSFMTDVPAFAWMSVALALAAGDPVKSRLLSRRSLAALLVAAFAFTIRNEAGVAFAAIAVCRLWSQGRPGLRRSLPWVAAVAGVGAAMLAFYIWRMQLPSSGGTSNRALVPIYQWWDQQWLFPLAGLMLAPVAIMIRPVRTIRLAWESSRTLLLASWALMPVGPVAVWVLTHLGPLTSGGTWGQKAAYLEPRFGDFYFSLSDFGGPGGRTYIPSGIVVLLGVLSVGSMLVCVSGVVLGLRRWLRPPDGRARPSTAFYAAQLLAVATLGECAIFTILVNLDLITWDRYIFRLIPYCGLLLLLVRARTAVPGAPTFAVRSGAGALAGLAALSVVVAIATDGTVGSQWTYSQRFAAAHPMVPKARIFTVWTWSSTFNQIMVNPFAANESPSYSPCYEERFDPPPATVGLDRAPGGSWVSPETFIVVPNPDARPGTCGPTTGSGS